MTAIACPASPAGADAPHAAFLALLPRLHLHAQLAFRDVACPQRKDDLVAEAVGLGWLWFRRLTAKGRDPAHFFAALARFAVRSARCGRGVARPEGRRDALSPAARRRHRAPSPRRKAASASTYSFWRAIAVPRLLRSEASPGRRRSAARKQAAASSQRPSASSAAPQPLRNPALAGSDKAARRKNSSACAAWPPWKRMTPMRRNPPP
jgi:hypothetical protein